MQFAPRSVATFTSREVSRIAKSSLRQLQWWDEQSVVSPRHDGHKRVYLPQEVIEVSVIAELRRKGFSLQKIRRVLRYLQREMGKRLSDALGLHSRRSSK
jgi:DNA-binding transcriptional MerR regulator